MSSWKFTLTPTLKLSIAEEVKAHWENPNWKKGQVCGLKSNGKDSGVRRYHRGKEIGEGEEGKLKMISVLLDANTLFRSSSNTLQIIFETLQNQRCRVSISARNLHSDFGKGRTER